VKGNAVDHFVERLTWDEVARRLARGAVAILPIGAASKEHGFHLPMNTDRVQAEWLAAHLAARFDALVWPTVTYGYYPAFVGYAGSVSLSEPVFESLVHEIIAGIFGFGCRALFVLDTGISTLAPVDRALQRLGNPGALHLKIHDGPRYRRAAAKIAEQSHGSHADELETSVMLALAPDLVEMARAEASPILKQESPGPLTSTDTASPNYSRSGSFGDPTLATPAKGEMLLAAMLDDLVDTMQTFLADGNFAPRIIQQQRRVSP
jgi:creatinine amidohydrolase